MTSFAFSVMFLLVTSQPATEVPAPQAPAAPVATTATAPEPKMICKYERTTGSRVQKTKICRPENEKGADAARIRSSFHRH